MRDSVVRYIAVRRLKIPNPNETPSSLRVAPGEIFSLDGSEGIHIDRLLAVGAVEVYEPPKPEKPARQRRSKS
tara:strand:+ start:9879 stop:10097 length:219 start_codon:yes stop_codon:yes gene_type:complete